MIFNWYNYSGISGFGDMITRLSEFYLMHENQDVHVNCYEKYKNWESIEYARKYVLSPPKSNITFELHEARQEIPVFSVKGIKRYIPCNFEYWPARILWKQKKTKRIAHWFSTKGGTRRARYADQYKAKNFYNVNHLKEIFRDYEFIELYDITNDRGNFKVISDKQSCIEKNMEILSDCELFIASEGGWTHISRSMKVPTVLHFNHYNLRPLVKLYERFQMVLDTQARIALNEKQMIEHMRYFL